MGDLFEVWIGDDAPGDLGREVAAGLAELAGNGTRIYFICGNRDFLIGDRFCRQAGMQRLEEPQFLSLEGERILLLHGDTLCTDDASYQKFRRKTRDPRWQRRILAKPAWLRRLMARVARWRSRRHTGSTESSIMDVNAHAVETAFRDHQVRRIIHGHTHRRAIHDLSIDQKHHQRIVLGDWGLTGSAIRLEQGLAMMSVVRNEDGYVELRMRETAAPLG